MFTFLNIDISNSVFIIDLYLKLTHIFINGNILKEKKN